MGTPLHNASSMGHTGAVKLLLECGAAPDIKNIYGKTAADMAPNEAIKEIIANAIQAQKWKFPKWISYATIEDFQIDVLTNDTKRATFWVYGASTEAKWSECTSYSSDVLIIRLEAIEAAIIQVT